MADFTRREVTKTWIEYTLPNPTVWGELHKVLAVVERDLGESAQWGDAAEVLATDEEIIVRYEKRT